MVNLGTMWKCSHWPETGTMTPCLLLCQSRYLYRSQQGEWATIVGECVPKDVQRHQTPEAPLIKILINPSHVLFLILQTVCWGLASVLGVRAMSQGSIVLLTLAFAMQIVFLLIAQYTVLSHINPGVGNWVEITGMDMKFLNFAQCL